MVEGVREAVRGIKRGGQIGVPPAPPTIDFHSLRRVESEFSSNPLRLVRDPSENERARRSPKRCSTPSTARSSRGGGGEPHGGGASKWSFGLALDSRGSHGPEVYSTCNLLLHLRQKIARGVNWDRGLRAWDGGDVFHVAPLRRNPVGTPLRVPPGRYLFEPSSHHGIGSSEGCAPWQGNSLQAIL